MDRNTCVKQRIGKRRNLQTSASQQDSKEAKKEKTQELDRNTCVKQRVGKHRTFAELGVWLTRIGKTQES